MKTIIIKIGTKILTNESNQLDLNNLRRLTAEISALIHNHHLNCIIVSSGAIVSGSEALLLSPKTIPEKQAAASVGQILLLKEYHQFFSQQGIPIGQMLLTKDITDHAEKRHNVTNTLENLLAKNIVPIINENDSVATDEIQFGDNDILTSIVAQLIPIDLVVFLTDTEGLYDKDPIQHTDASLLSHLTTISDTLIDQTLDAYDTKSKGGMKSKLIAAKTCHEHGIPVVIAHGRHPHLSLEHIIIDEQSGTWIRS
ncbi:glutamate 5-kinase [Candidatus Marinamargulisbacteria bacterium SCGC AG-333-B06]|nr:glutamate 5-kinase [Candidatus Marinamargulisbacteria bacterium SCGC AG-333-B06]